MSTGMYGHSLLKKDFGAMICRLFVMALVILCMSLKRCVPTHDVTASVVTGISNIIRAGKLNKKWHIVFDEAYKCTDRELSPWKGKHLRLDKDVFNYTPRRCIGK